MRKFGFLLLMVLSSAGFAQTRISVTVNGITDQVAYLGNHFADKRYVQDTVQVPANGVIEFVNAESYKPGLYFLYTPNVYFEFIVNEPEIVLETSGPNYAMNLNVISSTENQVFKEMQIYIGERRQEYAEIAARIDTTGVDTLGNELAENRLMEIDRKVRDYQSELIAEYPGTFVAQMVAAMRKPVIPEELMSEDVPIEARYNYYRNHYFDDVDMGDAGLLRTPVYLQKLTDFLDNTIVQVPDTVIKEIDLLLDQAKGDEEVYRYMLVTFANKYETSPVMGHDEVFVHIVDNYYLNNTADWMDPELIQKLRERVETMRPNFIGKQAPAITLSDTLYTEVALYDVNAEYTILYFYDPDCGHCKKKTPVLYEAYANLRNQNVEILAVNITTNVDRWKEYIRENDFDWVNLIDYTGRSNFRYYYDVRTTPTLFILDKEKKIIAKKLDAAQVESFINSHRSQSTQE